jgi:hypothetical protein
MSWISRRKFLGQVSAAGVLIAGIAERHVLAQNEPKGQAGSPVWRVSGIYAEACSCDAVCPCTLLGAPTKGYCQALVAWHIEDGRYGETQLAGLNALLAVSAPDRMTKGNWKVALYLDERATPEQGDALAGIFSGKAGGHLARIAPLIGQVLGVKAVPIFFDAQPKRRRFYIPGTAQAEIAAIEGAGGGEATIRGAPATLAPGQTQVLSRSIQVNYSDYGLSWELTEKNGFYAPFAYASA